MPEKNVIEVGTIQLNGEDYRLARTDEFKQAWSQEGVDEPPWEGGAPPLLSIEENTWHLGGFKSRQGILGTSEYGSTDNRWPFRMIPPPFVTKLDLTGHGGTGSIFGFFEALGYIWVVCTNGEVFRVHPTTFVVTLSKDVGSAMMGLLWEGTYGIVAANTTIWKVTTIGTPDTWVEGDVPARFLAKSINRLFQVTQGGLLRNVSTGLDPLTTANYADKVQCGSPDTVPNSMVAYENTVLVGTPENVFGVSADEGIGVPLIDRMIYNSNNCRGMIVLEPYVLVPHIRGLFRLRPGVSVESVGLEREVLNQTALSDLSFSAFVVDNQWVYGALMDRVTEDDTWILVSRERRSGEPGLGPFIWDTLINLGHAHVDCMHISVATTQPTLWFGHYSVADGYQVGYIKLPTGGSPPSSDCSFAASGVRYSKRYHFDDWNPKDFPKFQAACKDADATHYWSIAYKIDDTGSWITADIDGNAMDIKSDGVKTFYLATAAVGREIQFRFTYTGPAAGPSVYASLVYFKPFAKPQSLKVPVIKCVLHLAADIKHDTTEEARDAITQFNDLNTLSESATSVTSYGPWGEPETNVQVWVRRIHLLQTIQEGQAEPEYLVEATIQKREAA